MQRRKGILLIGAGFTLFLLVLLMKGKTVFNDSDLAKTEASKTGLMGRIQDIAGEIETAARIAWGEARNQGSAGLQAVLNVIDNRARRGGWWGNSHSEVATKPWQFSAFNRGEVNRAKLETVTDSDPQFAEAVKLAASAVSGNLPDITGGATHYHTVDIPQKPHWVAGATITTIIGDHIFYKDVA